MGIVYPKGPWTPGPPNHINYYILGLGGLVYHFGELDLFVYSLKYKGNWIYQGPTEPWPPSHISYYIFGFGGLEYHFGDLHLLVYHWKYNENLLSQGPWTPGPPNRINYYILGLGGLDHHLGELDLFVYHWTISGNLISQQVPGPRVPQTILVIILCDLVAWIVILKNWICLVIIWHALEIAYPKGPKTPSPPNNTSCYTLELCGLDYYFG